jgi:hypothetical protein
MITNATYRKLLEDVKAVTDAQLARESPRKPKKMVLYTPAVDAAIRELLAGAWGRPLPPSYGEFLKATDGIDTGWHKLDFLSTDKTRQKSLRRTLNYVLKNEKESFEAIYDDFDDDSIVEWESKPERAYLANHVVIAANQTGDVLFYDTRTRDRKGEMELCWKPGEAAVIQERYPNLKRYFESIVEGARKKAVGSKR